jgi:hypothetical protein
MNGSYNCPGIPRRIVRFADNVVARDDASFDIANPPRGAAGAELLRALVDATPGLRYSRVFSVLTPDEIDALIARARRRTPGYEPPDFLTYYFADPLPGHEAGQFDDVILSRRFREVVAYLRKSLPGRPPMVNPNDPWFPLQRYFHDAPEGTGAQHAWDHPLLSGAGEGFSVADVEVGFPVKHTDLPMNKILRVGPPGPVTSYYADHATAVLGILCARDNTEGVIGGAPMLNQALMCSNYVGGQPTTGDAITRAMQKLNEGDVILIEHQDEIVVEDPLGGSPITVGVPAEYDEDVYEAICLATAAGIIVVEAGGNGDEGLVPVDFDQLALDDGAPFDPNQPKSRESDAIVVSAAEFCKVPNIGNLRLPWAPYGNRVDCYARGVGIATTRAGGGKPATLISATFGGTSAAAAIIAATALQVQGLVKAKLNTLLSPAEMRSLFRDASLGTPALAENPQRLIGPMPDLEKIVAKLDAAGLP